MFTVCEGREKGEGRESNLLRTWDFQALLSLLSFIKGVKFMCILMKVFTEYSGKSPKPENDATLPKELQSSGFVYPFLVALVDYFAF